MPLTVATYDAEEQQAVGRLGYTEYAAFDTRTFDDFGFPTRMTDERQIFRYVDWYKGQDLRRLDPGKFYRDATLRTDYSMDEVAMLTKLANACGDITQQLTGRPIKTHFNHHGSIGLFRVVHSISQLSDTVPLSIFEVGPGCGYLGSMIGLAGHRYASYDVTQGYYIWQSRLQEYLFGREFMEIAGNPNVDIANQSRIMHLPWWRYANLYRECPIKADVIISDGNLGEMNLDSLRYMLRVSRIMMEESDVGLFIFTTYGAQHRSGHSTVSHEFESAGFELVSSEKVFGYCLKHRGASASLVAGLKGDIPLYSTGTSHSKTFAIRDFVDFDDGLVGDEYYFNAFIYDWPNVKIPK